MPAFVRRKLIRFHHCDPAGIVFYPQYFVLFNELVEDWFAEGLKAPFADLHGARRTGTPTVHLECSFMVPSRVGDEVDLSLAVRELGRASIKLDVALTKDGVTRLKADQTLVLVDLDAMKAIQIPDDLRQRIAGYTAESV